MGNWEKPPDVAAEERAHIALTAKKANCWIYNKSKKIWYTPEEFAFNNDLDVTSFRNKAKAPDIEILDPRIALDQANRIIKKSSEFIESHSKKIWAYYNLKKK